ncbi:hypothetical protein, partial [Escherichia coli]|uniref:hypothetical protein n=1 Tax=Escherichia coli TaxID=562 RepID=UPI003A98608E
ISGGSDGSQQVLLRIATVPARSTVRLAWNEAVKEFPRAYDYDYSPSVMGGGPTDEELALITKAGGIFQYAGKVQSVY